MTLAIETSTECGSVAICAGGEIVFHESFVANRSHSAELFLILQRAANLLGGCHRIVVGIGPGSYAGVRIGIAAAIGLRFATNAQLAGIPSPAGIDAGRFIAIGDARRGTFYFAEIDEGICLAGPLLATAEEVHERLAARSGVPVYSTAVLPEFETQIALPSAERLARLAEQDRGIVQTGQLEPIYLRPPHITQPKAGPDKPGSR